MDAPAPRPVADSTEQGSSCRVQRTVEQMQEDEVIAFVQLLESTVVNGHPDAASISRSKLLMGRISTSISEQDIVLKLPALEIGATDENCPNDPLPRVGETSNTRDPVNEDPLASEVNLGSPEKPSMAASVLTNAANDAAHLEQQAAKSIGNQTSWTKSTLPFATSAIASSIADSFSRLVDSRMKAWTLLLLRHSLSTGDASSRGRLLNILRASLTVQSTATRFTLLPLPESAKGQSKEADVVLPLLFEVTVTVSGQERSDSVVMRAPGTISAYMGDKNASSGLKLVDVQLDSGKFLSTMVEQVRMLVLKAVAKATKTQVPLPSNGSSIISLAAKKDEPLNAPSAAVSSSATLASFRSALRLSPESGEQTPSLLKARSSALRLNSILQGAKSSDVGAGTALGMRKVRSVRWNTPAQLPSLSAGNALAPVPKKTKTMSQSVAKLKSFKSFGRPHAGDFGSGPRNATFGEYGDRTHLWGRDGRLAHHPVPMMQANQNNFAGFEEPNKNATFDMNRPPMSFAGSRPMSSLPRTATVLENILLKKSTG